MIEILELLDQNGIEVYVDGGWGVDALLGRQTRRHTDLDIAIQHQYVTKLRNLLAEQGYREIPRDDSWECNFVLQDALGHQVDVHSYTFDEQGNHIFGVAYPVDSLTGSGWINDKLVKCISPAWMVQFHTGYPLDENDYRDVKALCHHFGLEMPDVYRPFEQGVHTEGMN